MTHSTYHDSIRGGVYHTCIWNLYIVFMISHTYTYIHTYVCAHTHTHTHTHTNTCTFCPNKRKHICVYICCLNPRACAYFDARGDMCGCIAEVAWKRYSGRPQVRMSWPVAAPASWLFMRLVRGHSVATGDTHVCMK